MLRYNIFVPEAKNVSKIENLHVYLISLGLHKCAYLICLVHTFQHKVHPFLSLWSQTGGPVVSEVWCPQGEVLARTSFEK